MSNLHTDEHDPAHDAYAAKWATFESATKRMGTARRNLVAAYKTGGQVPREIIAEFAAASDAYDAAKADWTAHA